MIHDPHLLFEQDKSLSLAFLLAAPVGEFPHHCPRTGFVFGVSNPPLAAFYFDYGITADFFIHNLLSTRLHPSSFLHHAAARAPLLCSLFTVQYLHYPTIISLYPGSPLYLCALPSGRPRLSVALTFHHLSGETASGCMSVFF